MSAAALRSLFARDWYPYALIWVVVTEEWHFCRWTRANS